LRLAIDYQLAGHDAALGQTPPAIGKMSLSDYSCNSFSAASGSGTALQSG
jgi:hypothetical protein